MVSTGYVISYFENISHHITELPASEAVLFGMSSILLICAIGALIARFLKQPLIPAYVITGLLAGPLVLGLITSVEIIDAFLEIGIVFLLFIAGLEISFKKIKEANLKKILLIGTVQVAVIFLLVFLLREYFGLTDIQSLYFGVILAFSSTMVDVKILSDRGEIVSLHGRLVLGILLLQDLVAIIAIALLTAGGFSIISVIITFLKLILIISMSFLFQKYLLIKLFKHATKSTELLFITALGVLFAFIIVSFLLEISIAIGAFIAGVSLANSYFKTELESRISPIKDFFSILFFVSLGMKIIFTGINLHIKLLIFLILGSLILKPILLFVLLRIGHYQKRTSFQTATTLGQLSEFSLIIGILGVSTGILTESLFSTVILATVITMSLTPYLIGKDDFLFKLFRRPASWFDFLPETMIEDHRKKGKKTTLLIGAHRIGASMIRELEKNKKNLIVIDYNPEITKSLSKKQISTIYGDIMSPDIFEKIKLEKLNLVISTLPGYEENLRILKKVKHENPRASVILTSRRISEAEDLYKKGADFVIMPKVIAGQELTKMITKGTKSKLKAAKIDHIKYLKEIHNVLF